MLRSRPISQLLSHRLELKRLANRMKAVRDVVLLVDRKVLGSSQSCGRCFIETVSTIA